MWRRFKDRGQCETWLDGLWCINRNMKDCQKSHLEFPPGVEFLQTLDRLLPVHHGGYGGSLLQEENVRGVKSGISISVILLAVSCTYADPRVFEGLCGSDAFTGVDG